jgi:hypothetical protein
MYKKKQSEKFQPHSLHQRNAEVNCINQSCWQADKIWCWHNKPTKMPQRFRDDLEWNSYTVGSPSQWLTTGIPAHKMSQSRPFGKPLWADKATRWPLGQPHSNFAELSEPFSFTITSHHYRLGTVQRSGRHSCWLHLPCWSCNWKLIPYQNHTIHLRWIWLQNDIRWIFAEEIPWKIFVSSMPRDSSDKGNLRVPPSYFFFFLVVVCCTGKKNFIYSLSMKQAFRLSIHRQD